MIEKFGYNEKALSEEDWLEIGNKMKTDHHIKLKNIRMVAEAEHQSTRFKNIAIVTGTVLFLAFLKFPVIRLQPGVRRVGASAALTFPFYYYLDGLATRLKVKRIKFAYRKHLVENGLHQRVTI